MGKKLESLLDRFEEAVRKEESARLTLEEAQRELAAVREEMSGKAPRQSRQSRRRSSPKKTRSTGRKKRGSKKTLRERVLGVVSDGQTWTAAEIAEKLKAKRPSVHADLQKLYAAKKIKRVGRGQYEVK